MTKNSFLPCSRAEMNAQGFSELDIILISGDAYIDHPSFGTAIIARVLQAAGYKVGIIAQPDWTKDADFLELGAPKLFFGISSGNMDSMVNHYTAQRKRRNNDAYSPNGEIGHRPDRAILIYCNILKRLFKHSPIVLGGIEASLRRIAHYDFWQDKVRNSILSDSKADILLYGMAEKPVLELADFLAKGKDIRDLQDIAGSVCFTNDAHTNALYLPPADACQDKETFYQMNKSFYREYGSQVLYQYNGGRLLKHNPPAPKLSPKELDAIYALPFQNAPHPRYQGQEIPAFEQIKNSITSHRGCYGGCHFCAIAAHQGRQIQSRSSSSILNEAKRINGTISDLGGPTANMYSSHCKQGWPKSCKRQSCLYPTICPNLVADHASQLKLLAELEKLPNIRHIFIASGIRHDMALGNKEYISALARKYTGGRLKLAPEHSSDSVLKLMGKPPIKCYEDFSKEYFTAVKKAGLKRQIVPYIIIGHPGTTMQDALALRNWLKKHKIQVEQVQEFTPTPMTISTCMYYTGLDFETGKPVHVPSPGEVRKQKLMII